MLSNHQFSDRVILNADQATWREDSILASTGCQKSSDAPITIWRVAVEHGRRHTEVTLEIGESIRVGDTVITIIETQDYQAAVLVEDFSVVDELV
jgi:hypothetical protein